MKEVIVLLFLAWNTRSDIRKKEVSVFSAAVVFLMGLILAFAEHTRFTEFAVTMGGGVIFLILSILTEGKIGMGDAWVLIAMAAMLKPQTYLISLMIGLLLASAYSGYLMLVKKRKKTTEIPFLPFLLLGYLGGLYLC